MNQNKGKVSIQFPNMLLIPLLSIICMIIKICGGITWNWVYTLVVCPVAIYFGWCIGYCILAILSLVIYKMVK